MTQQREAWRDGLRGLLILLLLLQHGTTRTYWSADIIPDPTLTAFCAVLKPLRMPVMMILAGTMLERSLRKDLTTFYRGKLRTLAWPFLVWGLLVMTQLDRLGQLADPTWIASSYLWFIAFLFTYFAAAPLVAKLPPWTIPATCATLVILAKLADTEVFGKYVVYAGLFYFGHELARSKLLPRLVEDRWLRYSGAGTLLAMGYAWLTTTGPLGAVEGANPVFLAAGGSVAALFALGAVQRWWPRNGVPVVNAIGRHSIVAYCTHMPVMIWTTTTLAEWDLTNPFALAAWNVYLALLVTWLAVEFRDWAPVGLLFEFPRPVAQLSQIGDPNFATAVGINPANRSSQPLSYDFASGFAGRRDAAIDFSEPRGDESTNPACR